MDIPSIAPFSRRTFISKVSAGAALLPLTGLYARAALASASNSGAQPKWPEIPAAPDAAAEKAPVTPPLHAKSEQSAGEKSAYLPASERVGYAIVGLGKLALEEILPAIRASHLCKVTALVSGHRDKALKVAAQYDVPEKNIYSYADFDRIRENSEVHVIYIVLPNSLHADFVQRSARAGKHVLCEKPMATNAAEARGMVDACKKAGVKLMIAYRQQYEPNNRWIRKLVREQTFGKVKLFEANNAQNQAGKDGGPQQWRHVRALAGGGALPDIGLYCLNAARFLSGEEPYEVQALTYSTPKDPRFTEVEETVSFTLRFPSGLVASCLSSYGAHETKRFRFTAETGWFGMEPAFAYHGLKTETSYALGGTIEHHDFPSIPEGNQFALEMDHFADCVKHGKDPHTPGEEGVQDHVIMDAIYESARTKKPVTLERIEKLDVFRPASVD